MSEPSLFYAPPYDTPAEDAFVWHLVKTLSENAGLFYQLRVGAPHGPLWIDVAAETYDASGGLRRVGFELSEAEASNWAERDAQAVLSGSLDALYRFPAWAALRCVADLVYLLSRWEPDLFSERGRRSLERLASPQTVTLAWQPATAGEVRVDLEVRTLEDDGSERAPERLPLHVVRHLRLPALALAA